MTILECKRYFKESLSDLYTESESALMYSYFVEKLVGFNSFHQRRFAHQDLLTEDQETLKNIIQELKTGKPYQHILGETEFYGLPIFVNEHVLIPRPETEELLELAMKIIRENGHSNTALKILDIGTGSGVIPIVLKKYFQNTEITTIDISEEAQEIAKKNAKNIGVELTFLTKDYLSLDFKENFDIIISNPPYIGQNEYVEIKDGVKQFEPNIALFSPVDDALIFYRKIAIDAQKHLNPNGWVFLEINQKLGPETLALYQDFSYAELIKDLSQNDRFVIAKK